MGKLRDAFGSALGEAEGDNPCSSCNRNIAKYLPKVKVRICRECKLIYCKDCGKDLPKGKCKECGKPTIIIKRPHRNPFAIQLTPEEKIQNEEKKGFPYMKIIWKGHQDSIKISFGIKIFSVGTEFGGRDKEEIELKCGSCGSSDKFRTLDRSRLLFECLKCNTVNEVWGKDKSYFTLEEISEDTKFCSNCGKKINNIAKFCEYCGNEV